MQDCFWAFLAGFGVIEGGAKYIGKNGSDCMLLITCVINSTKFNKIHWKKWLGLHMSAFMWDSYFILPAIGRICWLDVAYVACHSCKLACLAVSWGILCLIWGYPEPNYGHQVLHLEIRSWLSKKKWWHAPMQAYSLAFLTKFLSLKTIQNTSEKMGPIACCSLQGLSN